MVITIITLFVFVDSINFNSRLIVPCPLQKKVTSAYSLTIITYPSPYFPSPPILSPNSLYLSHPLSPIFPLLIFSPNSLLPSHPLTSLHLSFSSLIACPLISLPFMQPSHFPSLPLFSLPLLPSPHLSLHPHPFLHSREEGGGRRGSDLWCKPPHTGLL